MLSSTVAAQTTMYRCQDGAKVIYSDRPCFTGVEVKRLAPNGGPTREDVEKARMKSKVEEEKQRQEERAQRNFARERAMTNEGIPVAKRAADTAAAAPK
jgi:hypothetical protein